jgi:hypothetical protein
MLPQKAMQRLRPLNQKKQVVLNVEAATTEKLNNDSFDISDNQKNRAF